MENTTEMLKGLLEGCILEIIGRGETYGYEITQSLRKIGFSDVVEGTVYAILVRLEKNEFVYTEIKPSDIGPPRKFYILTELGCKERSYFWDKWNFISAKINELREI
ncbi:PadR family transcriptional regulator [Candidatus Saccharibacteria bacterium]|nr:PadR family transcriptional regulator [Candidatus Saccharibacteria bacterium]NCU40961.1 PadR family transcriptional regulator [Candidatus Saccharibacteria bacterium]